MSNLSICPSCNHTIYPNLLHVCTESSLFCTSGDSLICETDNIFNNVLIDAESSGKMIPNIYPALVGYYDVGDKKPRWFHRTMVRLVLGWKWVENVK